jgi:SAM-dependent methyltransferase
MSEPMSAAAANGQPSLCRLCGHIKVRPVLPVAQRWLVRCQGCQLVRLHPVPTAAELSEVYDSGAYYTTEPPRLRQGWAARLQDAVLRTFWGYPGERSLAERWLGPLLLWPLRRRYLPVPYPGRQPVLDVGCGNGQRLLDLKNHGCMRLIGLEPTLGAAEQARLATGADIRTTLLEDTELPPHHFGLIVMNQVLEHVPSPLDSLRRLRQLIRPDGSLYLTVPNYGSWEAQLFGTHWSGLQIPEHLHHFTRASLLKCLTAAGWQVLWCGTDTVPVVTHTSLRSWGRTQTSGFGRWLGSLPVPAWWPATWVADRLGRGQMLRVVAVRDDAGADR